MNLLYDFLKALTEADKKKLSAMYLEGRSHQVWKLLIEQTARFEFDRKKIEKQLQLSSAHFDKITSQLLSKCYEYLFKGDWEQLLSYLSMRTGYVKHFYHELKRQQAIVEKKRSKTEQAIFYKTIVNLIHYNMPIIHKDERVLGQMAKRYLALERNKNSRMLIACKLLYVHIDKLFAAAKIAAQRAAVQKKIDALGALPESADGELTFAYYWLLIYFYNALEDFATSAKVSKQALLKLQPFTDEAGRMNTLRIELKLAELNYYLSNFEESFSMFNRLLKTTEAKANPDYSYNSTKYLQVCLITNQMHEAKAILTERKTVSEKQLREIILPRDIISFAKYYLFAGELEKAFEYIQLGFEKNPKGKYFQYEVELRHLQTAYFYLNNQKPLAVQMCNKHIKYLRSHGYGVKQSAFPYFYVLTKAMYHKHQLKKKPSKKENEMLQRYQLGSFGVYGKLLLKMLQS